MTAPRLSNTMKRTYDTLRQGAVKQVTDYEQKLSSIENIYSEILAYFIRTNFDPRIACETAKEFFGDTTVPFAGVDGTMYSKPLFDMVIFFGGAYAATGTIKFSPTLETEVEYDEKTLQQSLDISSVVPIYISEIPDVDHSYSAQEQPGEVNPAKPLTDEEIANNSLIANSIMTFSEYYLAYKLASDIDQSPRIVLMDRSLSTDRASLLYETRKTDFWNAKSTLIGYKTSNEDEPIDKNDLIISRQHVSNQALNLPPARADYLRTSIVCCLEQNNTLTLGEIATRFDASDEKRIRRIERALKSLTERQILTEKEGVYSLSPTYVTSWNRVKKITTDIDDRFFSTKNTAPENTNPMKVVKNNKEHWLNTLDVAFLTLFTLQMLMEECWRKRILFIGITKDTAARDFKRQLVPILQNEGLLRTDTIRETLEELPNTDRMILQSASIFNTDKLVPPWSLIEYDSAFRTMLPDRQSRRGYVSGAIRNKISLERTFVKTYVQLSQAKTDPMLRSNVLLINRLTYPDYDYTPDSLRKFWNELSDGTREPVEAILYRDKTVPNRLQNLCMNVLIAMAPANIPEALGHNKALFIADKIAKWNFSQFKSVVDTTATWILNNHKLRKFIFYMSTFRERRASIEQARRERP